MKYYSIGEFAEKVGVTRETLRNWHKDGTLAPHHILKNGYRYYSEDQVTEILGMRKDKIVAYHWVKEEESKDSDKEIAELEAYMKERKYHYKLLVSKGEAIEQLAQILEWIVNTSLSKLVLLSEEAMPKIALDLFKSVAEQQKFKIFAAQLPT